MVGVIFVVLLFVGAFVAWQYMDKQIDRDKENNKMEVLSSCAELGSVQLQESCINNFLKIEGRDPETQKIEMLERQLEELKIELE